METKEDIIDHLLSFLRTQYPRLRAKDISVSADLIHDRIIDSLGILDMIAFIEDNYNIHVSDTAVESNRFSSLSSIADYIIEEGR